MIEINSKITLRLLNGAEACGQKSAEYSLCNLLGCRAVRLISDMDISLCAFAEDAFQRDAKIYRAHTDRKEHERRQNEDAYAEDCREGTINSKSSKKRSDKKGRWRDFYLFLT